MKHVFDGEVTLADRARSPFLYLPFPVPQGATRLNISYDYSGYMPADQHYGGNTIDIGLFGPGGTAFGTGDFRGWSGSFRKHITVGLHDATPAYLPGLPPGQWNVLLGLYNIAEDGCRYHVEAEVLEGDAGLSTNGLQADTEAAPAGTSATSDPPTPPTGPRWFRGDLHCHTFHSDGHSTLKQMTDHARERGLDFLAMTDHNTVSHHAYLAGLATPTFLPIPGEEITTYFGHANVWGIHQWVDFRCATPEDAARAANLAHQQGVLFSINHPKYDGPPWLLGTDLDFDCMEVWQAPWWVYNYESRALWESLLRQGRRVIAVGGSDLHRVGTPADPGPYPIGSPTTWVYASGLTQQEILAGIRQGHVFISADPAGPRVEFTAETDGRSVMMGDTLAAKPDQAITFNVRVHSARDLILRLIGPGGVLREAPIETDASAYRFPATSQTLGSGQFPRPYLRVEVIQPPEADLDKEPAALIVEAMSNPIWVEMPA